MCIISLPFFLSFFLSFFLPSFPSQLTLNFEIPRLQLLPHALRIILLLDLPQPHMILLAIPLKHFLCLRRIILIDPPEFQPGGFGGSDGARNGVVCGLEDRGVVVGG